MKTERIRATGARPARRELERVGVLPRPAEGQVTTSRRWLRLARYAVLIPVAIAALYVVLRQQQLVHRAIPTTQTACLMTSWHRVFHPSPFDELCPK